MIRVANAPVSYGAFELTVGVSPAVPACDEVLDAIAAAGYAGTELGPPGYLGAPDVLRARLEERGLALAGAFVEVRFGEDDLRALDAMLALLDGFDAKVVLADSGPRLGRLDWDGVRAAAERARARGIAPTFHHHMGTRVQTVGEIDELLERTDLALLLDTGHLTAAGGDAVQGLLDWRGRVDHVHVKDVRLDVLRAAAAWSEAWRGGVFCELGTGDVDLEGFVAELDGYAGWVVVEQDWIPADGDFAAQAAAQERNRRWLAEHAGL